MSKEIPTEQYMVDGWNRGPIGCHPYQRGSRHNKIGMWIMWIFYVIVITSPFEIFILNGISSTVPLFFTNSIVIISCEEESITF